jgi:hypothetical protein
VAGGLEGTLARLGVLHFKYEAKEH